MRRLSTVLARLMAHKPLRGARPGPEDAMCVEFANELRVATLEGRMIGVWFHPAQELCFGHKTGVRAAISRAMGMHVGVGDYAFLWADGAGVLEAKHGRNGLTDNQDDFARWCELAGVRHGVFRSVSEGLCHLSAWGVLL